MFVLPTPRTGLLIGAAIISTFACGYAPCRAGDIAKGRRIASVKCQMCHGMDGQAKLPEAPNLAGQVEQYLTEQMQAYREGKRKNDMMSLVVPTLSESEVADVIAYYAAIQIKIEKVPGQ